MGKFIWTKGSRKTAVARVRLHSGKGNFIINGKKIQEYLSQEILQDLVLKPFIVTETNEKFDILVNVKGGGFHAQAEAIRHGLARALVETDEKLRGVLKSNGFLKRDPRMVERKKYGFKKARKSFQFSKR